MKYEILYNYMVNFQIIGKHWWVNQNPKHDFFSHVLNKRYH